MRGSQTASNSWEIANILACYSQLGNRRGWMLVTGTLDGQYMSTYCENTCVSRLLTKRHSPPRRLCKVIYKLLCPEDVSSPPLLCCSVLTQWATLGDQWGDWAEIHQQGFSLAKASLARAFGEHPAFQQQRLSLSPQHGTVDSLRARIPLALLRDSAFSACQPSMPLS